MISDDLVGLSERNLSHDVAINAKRQSEIIFILFMTLRYLKVKLETKSPADARLDGSKRIEWILTVFVEKDHAHVI